MERPAQEGAGFGRHLGIRAVSVVGAMTKSGDHLVGLPMRARRLCAERRLICVAATVSRSSHPGRGPSGGV
jgi:hypothetical protein